MADSSTQSLLKEITQLRSQLVQLIATRDELKFRTCEKLEDDYQKKLGSLEYRSFKIRYETMRIQQKINLIEKKFQEGEAVFLPQIESELDNEFESYISQLRGRRQRIMMAQHHEAIDNFLDDDEELLREYYQVVIEKIHPDLSPYGHSPRPDLFLQAVDAYRNGMGYKLYRISKELEDEPSLPYPFEYASIQHIHDRYHERIIELTASIGDIEISYPYNLKETLTDRVTLYHMQQRLYNEMETWQHTYADYERQLDELLGGRAPND